ncbi:MAG: restriction endonuclease subunit S [Polyangia bacterium]
MDLVSSEMATIADSPGGISHLRDIILQAAIMGRLGTHRPEDKSAVDLAALGERLAREGKTRQRPSEDSLPRPGWALPTSWTWSCPSDLGIVSPRNDIPDSAEVGFVPMALVPTDYREPVRSEPRKWGEIKKGYTHFADGDIAVARITPCFQNGKSCVMNGLPGKAGAGSTEYHVLRPFVACVVPQYLLLFFKTPYFIGGGVSRMTGTAGQQRVPGEYFAFVHVPLPPLAEQKRIVAKVDQLMALCDDLEAKQTKKRDLATQSTHSALTALNTAENAAALATAWQRIDSNFPLISREPGTVADLRGSVLSLAVSGRLVVPSKARLVDVPVGEHYDPEFGIPEHWKWAPLGQLCRFIDYRGRTPRKTKEGVRLITAKNVRMGYIKEDPFEYIAAEEFDRWMTRGLPAYGDVLFTTEAPLGNVAQLLTRERVALAQRIITLHPIVAGIDPAYLRMALMSPLVQSTIKAKATGTTAQGIKAARLKLVPFPVPPPDEQARIVARVDALMSLLDDLEAKLRKQEQTATRLAESLAAAVAAAAENNDGSLVGDREICHSVID